MKAAGKRWLYWTQVSTEFQFPLSLRMLGPERLLEISHPTLMVDWAAERGKDIGVKVINMLGAEVGVETRYPQYKQSGALPKALGFVSLHGTKEKAAHGPEVKREEWDKWQNTAKLQHQCYWKNRDVLCRDTYPAAYQGSRTWINCIANRPFFWTDLVFPCYTNGSGAMQRSFQVLDVLNANF